MYNLKFLDQYLVDVALTLGYISTVLFNHDASVNLKKAIDDKLDEIIKIVTKKILKKTNYIHSRFKDNKTMISSQSEFDIKKSIKNRKFNESNI